MREAEILAELRSIFDRKPKPDLKVGNGDDGAVFSPGGRQVVVSSDLAVEGVHFRKSWSSSFEIGRKITAANLADICAMGGWPEYLIVNLALPIAYLDSAPELARGIVAESDRVGAQVIGGDLSTGNELMISITALGYCDRAIERSGAKVGDAIVVSALPGSSAAGLELLRAGKSDGSELAHRVIAQHKAPQLDYERYRQSSNYLTSATDISDGLVVDATHLADASRVKFALDGNPLRASELSELDREHYLEWVLGGGEDHILLGTTNQPQRSGLIVIGRVEAGSGVTLDGEPLENLGYSHNWSTSAADKGGES